MTDLDAAHAAMEAAPDDDAARLRFYERLADSEIFLLLGEEAEGDQITPALFDVEGGKYALIFDGEERLSDFVGRIAPYAALPGRALVQMLAGQGVGLGLNLEVAPSAMLIPADAVDWLAQTLLHAPSETEARLTSVAAPRHLPQSVVTGLGRKLAIAAGLAQTAYLVAATYDTGAQGHVLAFIDAAPGAEKALASAAGEALTFSGIEAGMMDVLFLRASDPMAARLAKVGLRFDLPQPAPQKNQAPSAPGMDPAKPPKLR
ncbi:MULTISPECIES: SseB family protein [unclassified Yoonia]|uniref:SseB family protein n=1 Tax=unclassified Yoonia TaxID=2629118 RepID=UPI002AFF1DC7|nr:MULTISPECIES: SseB family protein [unclassified Yoonia]